MRKTIQSFVVVLIVAACVPVFGDVRLTLSDGQELEGREIKREPGFYMLELDGGNVLPLPDKLVVQVEFIIGDEKLPGAVIKAGPVTLAGPPEGPRLPTLAQQLRVLQGSTSRFRSSIIDPSWQPTSDWDNSPEINNNFNPARWYRAPIDPNWTPVNSLGKDVTEFNPAHWYQAPIDPTWRPTDGFGWRDR